jgi:6,7-dimethyl-8-ribityllumazine synthase
MQTYEGHLSAAGIRFAIVVSRWNSFITERLLEGALDTLRRHGASDEHISIVRVPGSFEIPLAVQRVAQTRQFDAIVALGALIRGATPHFDYISAEVTKGIAAVSLEQELPITYGVLTCDTIEQAVERAGTKAGNKGAEAALSAVEMVDLFRNLPKPTSLTSQG